MFFRYIVVEVFDHEITPKTLVVLLLYYYEYYESKRSTGYYFLCDSVGETI